MSIPNAKTISRVSHSNLITFEMWNEDLFSMLPLVTSKKQKDTIKRSLVKELKKENYPKQVTLELTRYIKSL